MSEHQQTVTIEGALDIARQHLDGGRDQEAAHMYQRVLHMQPENAVANRQLGIIALAAGNDEAAVELIFKAIAFNPSVAEWHYDLGLVYQNLGRMEDASGSYGKALRLKPDYAEAFNNQGIVFRELGKLTEAIDCYRKAVSLQSDYAAAHSNLGLALDDLGNYTGALESFHNALAISPNYAEVHYNLGTTLQTLGRLSDAVESFESALKLNPNISQAHTNLGLALQDLGKFEESKNSYEAALTIDPELAEARHNLGILQLLLGNFEDGWKNYGWRWRMRKREHHPSAEDKPVWDGSKRNGSTMYIYPEQGFGDTIQFVRYLPFLRKAGYRVVLESPPSLSRLFRHSEVADEILEPGNIPPGFDCHAALLDIPELLKTTRKTIPQNPAYLHVAAETEKQWHDRLGTSKHFRIGIAWAGNSEHKNDHYRSVDASLFAPITKIPDVHTYSLQVGREGEASERFGNRIIDLAPHLSDFSQTAAAIEHLDLVISVDTSVAHLAGALGKPVWALLQFVPDWRWLLEGEGSLWYPTMRLFRQKSFGNWQDVFKSILAALEKQVSSTRH